MQPGTVGEAVPLRRGGWLKRAALTGLATVGIALGAVGAAGISASLNDLLSSQAYSQQSDVRPDRSLSDSIFIEQDDIVHEDGHQAFKAKKMGEPYQCTPIRWAWNFGDGTTEVREGTRTYPNGGPRVEVGETVLNDDVLHDFDRSGRYMVRVEVTDDCDNTFAGTRRFDIRTQPNWEASIIAVPTEMTYFDEFIAFYTLDVDPANMGKLNADTAWGVNEITPDRGSVPIINTGPHGQRDSQLIFTLPKDSSGVVKPTTYYIAVAVKGDDIYRQEYWNSDLFINCNSSFKCIGSFTDMKLITHPPYERCTEDDGGRNAARKGTAFLGSNAYTDACYGEKRVLESSCTRRGDVVIERIPCEGRCVNGACRN